MEQEHRNFDLIATTLFGLEKVLAKEIKSLGGSSVKIENRAVRFNGSLEVLYNVNYKARTALRVFRILSSFSVQNSEDLYKGTYNIFWPKWMDVRQTFLVDSVVFSPNFSHSGYVALKVKDAVADRFRKEKGLRPSVDTRNPMIRIMVHLSGNKCTLSLDSSGASLHKRGYRVAHGMASLNEVLAAGMVLLSGWNGKSAFLDPMCGSATLPIEAALWAMNIPPGYFRNSYSFMNWKDYSPSLFNKIKSESAQATSSAPPVYGSDKSSRQIREARLNLERAGLSHNVRLRVMPFNEVRPSNGNGVIIMNLPYGERIKTPDIQNLYAETGTHLKRYFSGWNAWILSANEEGVKSIGLNPSEKIDLYNGKLKCKFLDYVLYEGSAKIK